MSEGSQTSLAKTPQHSGELTHPLTGIVYKALWKSLIHVWLRSFIIFSSFLLLTHTHDWHTQSPYLEQSLFSSLSSIPYTGWSTSLIWAKEEAGKSSLPLTQLTLHSALHQRRNVFPKYKPKFKTKKKEKRNRKTPNYRASQLIKYQP